MKETEDSLTAPVGSSERDEAGEASSKATTQPSGSALPSEAPTRIKQLPEQSAAKQRAPFSIGDRFVVERELGRGGIGVTYLAIDTGDNNCQVAIKVLLKRSGKERAWIERHFRAEVEALSRINHPGVVRLVASGNTLDGEPYLAMEFVEGCDLRSQIEPEKGLGDFERTARIIRQLGEAINAAHDKGIYHRDLKPENIMIQSAEEGEQVKVIDFGIATVKESLDEKTKTTVLAGSVRYMAPEQILGKPTRATDIYALGIIAYEMITGRTPFNPDLNHPLASMQQLMEMQRAGVRVMPKDLRPSLPERAQEVILRALEYDRGNRYQRADQFGAELAEALSQEDGDRLVESYLSNTPGARARSTPRPSPGPTAQKGGQQAENVDESQPRRAAKVIGLVAGLLIAVTLLLFAWSHFKGGTQNDPQANGPTAAQEHTLSYWVLAQKYNDNRPEGAPVRLFGREMYFGTGDELQFFVTSSDSGHLYLLSEEPSDRNSGSYFLLFPTPKANNSSSQIQANSEVATDRGFFDERLGTEKVWIIWSASAIPELEAEISKWKDKEYLGEITEPTRVALIKNLIEESSKDRGHVEQDDGNNRMNIKGRGNVIVRLVTLAHR
jgi:serine/threonine protein kinase